jgi:hypothetical protein
VTISPSTASAAKVIVASHSGQLAFTGQNRVTEQGHPQQLHARRLPTPARQRKGSVKHRTTNADRQIWVRLL